ncbi:hypothetical protein M8494_00905 [Serratia ureilytica]
MPEPAPTRTGRWGARSPVDSANHDEQSPEYIEARWLFNASAEQMEVIPHPQSVIHSMVRYADGSGWRNWVRRIYRTPIAHAMASGSARELPAWRRWTSVASVR